MACLETCFDCDGRGCTVCNGTGGIVVDTMVYGAIRGWNEMPKTNRLDASIRNNKPSFISRILNRLF